MEQKEESFFPYRSPLMLSRNHVALAYSKQAPTVVRKSSLMSVWPSSSGLIQDAYNRNTQPR